MSVDLPAPLRPIRPMFLPGGIAIDRLRKTYRRPLGVRYDFVTFLSSNTFGLYLTVLGGDKMHPACAISAKGQEQQNQGEGKHVGLRYAVDRGVVGQNFGADQF